METAENAAEECRDDVIKNEQEPIMEEDTEQLPHIAEEPLLAGLDPQTVIREDLQVDQMVKDVIELHKGQQPTHGGDESEEGIWQRVKRRRTENHKPERHTTTLFEPSLPVTFSSVSIYSAHSPIPLPIISPLHKRLKTKDEGEILDAGRKTELACWRRPNRAIPSRTFLLRPVW